jgi:3-oxoadipate enol-lactonase
MNRLRNSKSMGHKSLIVELDMADRSWVLNGFAATSADWDLSFIDGLASSNELILLDNRGIGRSRDNGRPFDIAQLADDATRVIEILGIERTSLLGWSMGGFIAQTLAL